MLSPSPTPSPQRWQDMNAIHGKCHHPLGLCRQNDSFHEMLRRDRYNPAQDTDGNIIYITEY